MFRRSALRYLILLLALLANLAIADAASAGLKQAACMDPETGETVECCVWCMIFCDCPLLR
jgi:hypothetical protein